MPPPDRNLSIRHRERLSPQVWCLSEPTQPLLSHPYSVSLVMPLFHLADEVREHMAAEGLMKPWLEGCTQFVSLFFNFKTVLSLKLAFCAIIFVYLCTCKRCKKKERTGRSAKSFKRWDSQSRKCKEYQQIKKIVRTLHEINSIIIQLSVKHYESNQVIFTHMKSIMEVLEKTHTKDKRMGQYQKEKNNNNLTKR